MKIRKMIFSTLLACLVGLLFVTPALAFPPLPSSFYGKVKVNRQNVPDGTVVLAMVDGKVYAEGRTQTYQGDSVYSLDAPGDDVSSEAIEGGKEGDVITFEVGGVTADQTGVWHSGTNTNLDLSTKNSAVLATPPPALTPLPTQTAITAGVPVTGPDTNQPAADNGGKTADVPSIAGLIIGLAAVVFVGGGSWMWIARRRKI